MGEVKEKKELTYEELKTVADQLHQQNQMLIKEVNQRGNADFHKRVEYLFKVIENKSVFNEGFVSNCAKEIQSIITIPEQVEEQK